MRLFKALFLLLLPAVLAQDYYKVRISPPKVLR